ncbi:MAG: glycogen/starch synthase [Prevotellaceae bacterium]|jgi:glycosyltransferase involved in cell wall biosynthesis|nr:glycogen/starch synthase [Prevotellaceae bacterium]
MKNNLIVPDYIFEASWEVCNKVGGIYTVLSTRAKTLQERWPDRIVFIGPDIPSQTDNPLFAEDDTLFATWKNRVRELGLSVRIGRWQISGNPIVILVDYRPFFNKKNYLYTIAWEHFGVDSIHAYGDYDEACMFACAAAKAVEYFYRFELKPTDKVVFQAHEWMTGMGLLYLKTAVPEIATIFTTHATTVGRSIAGNDKPLYDALRTYDGDEMAKELNIESKHSVEKQTARYADCFTTVSAVTARECEQLLEKPADTILMNGFNDDLVPVLPNLFYWKKRSRETFLHVANCLTGGEFDANTLIIGTSGRYEYQNKGIDLFVETLHRLSGSQQLRRKILAFVCVPADVASWRSDLRDRLLLKGKQKDALNNPTLTHWLNHPDSDRLLGHLKYLGLQNTPDSKVTVIFVPCYLDGKDGIFNTNYYNLLMGLDLTIYPSYYEPWGYTPLESIAFRVPTITTDLSGFGQWVDDTLHGSKNMEQGVAVIHRTDTNYFEAADELCRCILHYSTMDAHILKSVRRNAESLAEQASWNHFIRYYYEAYDVALKRATARQSENN